jgi:type I restriction enzyme S subunit
MTEVPGSWKSHTLRDWGMQAQSGFASGAHNSEGNGVIHLRPMNVSRLGKLDFDNFKSVEDNSSRRIQKGDILFNNTNSAELVGKTALVDIDGDFAFSNHMTRLRFPVDKVLHEYMAILLHSFWMSGYFNEICSNHVNQASVSIKRLEQVEVSLPPIDEQHKIVELLEDHLSRLDAALADVKQAKIKAAQFRRSLLQAAFTGNLGSRGTGSLTEIPSDWNWVTLDEAMSECKNGLTYRNNPELAGFPVSRIETISKGEIDFQKVGYGGVSLEGNQKHLLTPGDILFSHINSMLHVGKVAIYKSGMPALLHGMNLLRITTSDGFVPEFLFFLFQSSDVRKQIWSKAKHAVNQASINIGELKTVVVPKPPIKEQQKIVEILEDHLSRLEASVLLVDAMEKQSIGLRRSLLQASFTGQLTNEVESV